MLNNNAATHCSTPAVPIKEENYRKAKQYAKWKNEQRREGLKKLSVNLKSYSANKKMLYIRTNMSVAEYKKYMYLGE